MMKTKIYKLKLFCVILANLLFVICNNEVFSQSNPSYTLIVNTLTSVNIGNNLSVSNINKTYQYSTNLLRERNKSARIIFKLDLGDDYVQKNNSASFNASVDFSFQVGGGNTVNKSIQIDNTSPEAIKIEDILTDVNLVSSTSALPFTMNIINVTKTTTDPFINSYLNKLRLSVSIEREFEVDVRYKNSPNLISSPLTISPVVINGKLATFSWNPSNIDAYPNYELQLLKLNNTDLSFSTNLNQIKTVIDWEKALKVETQSYKNNFTINISEGTGFYIWRVRPIGTYFKAGIANSENYGEWSYSFSDGSTQIMNKNSLTNGSNTTLFAFYFNDPDEKINWIYNRVFTEGDVDDKVNPKGIKSSEGINYADGLLNSKQSQKYNSSEDITIVSQTLTDYSGRSALNTIPVPVSGNLSGYKLKLVQNNLGQLYTAADFDDDNNYDSPSQVNTVPSTMTAPNLYEYYSGNNSTNISNTNVPSAEGYPFKRTLFKTDGTNRVNEESGVGKRHALGLQTNDMGRTTRIMFGTPSDDELIRIFGEEAPLAESVIKTITIDPNNVASVTYTSKEGKTIATALLTENIPNLDNLNTVSNGNFTVVNSINQSNVLDGKIVGSKRIVIPKDDTEVMLSYATGGFPNSGGCAGGDCNLKLRFYIINLTKNINYRGDYNKNTPEIDDFPQSNTFSSNNWEFKSMDPLLQPITVNVNGKIELQEGEYLFVKEISSSNDPGYAASIVDAQDESQRLIIDAIISKMKAVNSANTKQTFDAWYQHLISAYTSYVSTSPTATEPQTVFTALRDTLGISALSLEPGFTFPTGMTLSPLTPNNDDPSFDDLSISTSCCGTMSVQVPKPSKCTLCEGSSAVQYTATASLNAMILANNTNSVSANVAPYGMDDFKADVNFNLLTETQKVDAINSLVYIEMIKPLKSKMDEIYPGVSNYDINLWKIAPGFSLETLQSMFAHMLASRYYTGNTILVGTQWYDMSKTNDGKFQIIAQHSNNENFYDYNYDCKSIFNGWTSALELLNTFDVDGGSDIVGGFNEQDGDNSAQNEVDDDSNWEESSNLEKKYLKNKISKEMEDFNNSDDGKIPQSKLEALTSLVSNFLNVVGYQYAAVVDGETLPSYLISSNNSVLPSDFSSMTSAMPDATACSNCPNNSILTSISVGGNSYEAPYLFSTNTSGVATLTETDCNASNRSNMLELYYPYTVRPDWMFKYFTYNKFDGELTTTHFIEDDNTLLPTQVLVEINRGYNPISDYIPMLKTTINGSSYNYNSAIPFCNQPSQMQVVDPNNVLAGGSISDLYFTHENWSSAERMSFYFEIKGAPKCFESRGYSESDFPPYDPPSCPDKPFCFSKSQLIEKAITALNSDLSSIEQSAASIKAALINELTSSCYIIVKCKSTPANPAEITVQEIDLMVNKVITDCKTQVNQIKDKLTAINVPVISCVGVQTGCNTYPTNSQTYSSLDTDLPYSVRSDCQELVLTDENHLVALQRSEFEISLFSECDQKLREMLIKGTFIPYIAPVSANCPKTAPVYITDNAVDCLPSSSPAYGEKTYNTGQPYKTYSKTYQVSAGQ